MPALQISKGSNTLDDAGGLRLSGCDSYTAAAHRRALCTEYAITAASHDDRTESAVAHSSWHQTDR